MEGTRVLAQRTALRRRHRGPATEAVADFLLARGWKARPAQRTLGQPMLARRVQAVPLRLQGGEHPLLVGGKAGPGQWLRLRGGRRRLHRTRRTALGEDGAWRGDEAGRGQQQERQDRSSHVQRLPRERAEATAGWLATQR